MFSLICAQINGSVNNGEAGDLRRYRAHYDVIVMYMVASLEVGSQCQKQVSRAGTSNYLPQYPWDVITCPCPWNLLLAHKSQIKSWGEMQRKYRLAETSLWNGSIQIHYIRHTRIIFQALFGTHLISYNPLYIGRPLQRLSTVAYVVLGHYHIRWCLGSLSRHGISSHSIDHLR